MSNEKNNSHGYMTVGEVAKKMGVTVRTLQYYDKEGLVSPSSISEGGRRLYSDKDLILLHQILSLKSLGFSLDDIKNKLPSLDTPQDVAKILSNQAVDIKNKIQSLEKTLSSIEQLKSEVLQMQSVDFKKYADIIVNLQMENEYYYLIKKFDDDVLDHVRNQFTKDSGLDFLARFNQLSDDLLKLKRANENSKSEKSQKITKEYWNLIMEFTNGDMSLLPKLMEMGKIQNATNEFEEKQVEINDFLESALEFYFSTLQQNPFENVEETNNVLCNKSFKS